MNTERSDIGSSFAADVENSEVALIVKLVECAGVDCANTKLALDGGDKWWALEESTSQGLQSARKLCLSTGDLLVKADYAHIFLSGTLL